MAKSTYPWVVSGEEKMPFSRGIMTHSLMDIGLNFQEAYRLALTVRETIKGREIIEKEELAQIVEGLLLKEFGEDTSRSYRMRKQPPVSIFVQDEDSGFPFSKGILSQSIQAAGLEPNNAYDVARQIEATLTGQKRSEVSYSELKNLTFNALLKNYGKSIAERYLIWRKHSTSDRPVVVLIGGATGAGKSSLSAEVAHRLGISRVVSTDSLRQIMRIMFSPDLLPVVHSSSYAAWKELDYPFIDKADPVIGAFREQVERVTVCIRAMIDRAIEENMHMIIDGVHVVPGFINLRAYEDKAYIIEVVIVVLDKNSYRQRFVIRQDTASRRPFKRYLENFDSIYRIQKYIIEMAEHYNCPTHNNIDFEKTVLSVIRLITDSLCAVEQRHRLEAKEPE
ncbi:2-phosphoglycerate kinase [bacterium (candidate division B38) B3_B38]|nr:MAG: 2-phosphoglycerate kinase [bacterium (candidate division B38) B3_B38]